MVWISLWSLFCGHKLVLPVYLLQQMLFAPVVQYFCYWWSECSLLCTWVHPASTFLHLHLSSHSGFLPLLEEFLLLWMLWGLLKVFLPKACTQCSLCRQSLAQLFEATAELGLWQRVNLTNMKKSVMYGCDCHVLLRDNKRDLTFWTWLDVC